MILREIVPEKRVTSEEVCMCDLSHIAQEQETLMYLVLYNRSSLSSPL